MLQGKDLFMDLDEGALKLIDPDNLTILNAQPIHTIRVWGVGRDNGRYVFKSIQKKCMNHIFKPKMKILRFYSEFRNVVGRRLI